jgi:hypothetical protein
MSAEPRHTPDRISVALIAQHLNGVTSGEPTARDQAVARLTQLLPQPTEEAWLSLLLDALIESSPTRRPVPTVTDDAMPAHVRGRIVHVDLRKSSTSGASIAFVTVVSETNPTDIYGPFMLYRSKDVGRAVVSDKVFSFDIAQPPAAARAARAGGLRATGTIRDDDE